MKDYITILQELREDTDTKQETLGIILNIGQSNYSKIEKRKRKLTIEELMTLCHFYKKSPNFILGWQET